MSKLMWLLFASLTLGALYLTAHDIGVQDASAKSVREGSVGNSLYRGGK
jgi:hypothetical protein